MLLVSLEKCVYYQLSNTINLAQESLGEKQVFLDAKPCDFRISLNRCSKVDSLKIWQVRYLKLKVDLAAMLPYLAAFFEEL